MIVGGDLMATRVWGPGLRSTYVETFDEGPGGWQNWGTRDPKPDVRNGIFRTEGPWRVDPNHAPPGAGYLHLLAYLHTL